MPRMLRLESGCSLDPPKWMRWLQSTGLLLLCLWSMNAQSLRAQDAVAPLPLADYQAKLLSWQRTLSHPDGAAQISAIQQEITAIRQIELPAGAVITVQPLLGVPGDATIDLVIAQTRLATLIDELTAAATDETAARLALLTTIFARAEFVTRDSLWDRFWRWLRNWLPEIRGNESSTGTLSPLFQWLGLAFIGVSAVLLIWLLSYWLQNLLGTFMGGVERRATDANGERPPTAAMARRTAHQLADAGSYREAVRHLYLSALLTLYERNLITYQPSDTNREVLTAIRDQPLLHQQLQPVIETFDDVWYGVHEPDRTSFDSYVAAVEKLEEAE